MNILFVCWGNICRSPSAHAIMQEVCKMKNLNWNINSCRTQAHVYDDNMDQRMQHALAKHGIQFSHKPTQMTKELLNWANLIFVSDPNREFDVQMLIPKEQLNKIYLLRSFDSHANGETTVPDPYYLNNFDEVVVILQRCCERIVEKYSKI